MCIVPPPQCSADEYLDASTNTCQPKPGCFEGEQLPHCSDASEPRNKKELGDPDCDGEGNPINPATGNKYQHEVDYVAATGGLSFERSYNSASDESDVMGYGWRHHWQASLKRYDHPDFGTYIVATRPDGQAYFFTYSGGAWVNEADITSRLTQSGSQYILKDGTSRLETYDSAGKLLSVEAAGGQSFTLSYSGSQLVSVLDQFGRSLSLAYNGQGRLASVTDPASKVTSFAYSGNGNLTSVTYPDNKSRTYHYENGSFPYALTGITDENGNRYATWSYDSQGRAKTSTHAGGADSTTLAYSTNLTTITGPLGLVRTRTFTELFGVRKSGTVTEPCGSCGSSSASTTYDANGFVASRTDFNGNVTNYTHDARGLEISRTEAVGTPEQRSITTSWHPAFRLPTEINEPGRRTEFTYDGDGNRLTMTVTDTTTSESRTTTYTYTTQGLLQTIDGPRSNVTDVTSFGYDSSGNLTSVTNALNQVTQITSHDAHGNPLTIVDPNGVTTTLTYDLRQRLTSRTVAGATTTFGYDNAGNLTQLTLPTGTFLSYTYDAAQRLTDIRDNQNNRIHYILDAAGNRTREDVYDPSGVLKRRLQQEYDSQSRLSRLLGANGQTMEYGYDDQGNPITALEASAYLSSTDYDALDRAFRVTDAASGITEYGYNALDQLQTVKDPTGLTTSYTYNAFGEVIQQASPDTGTTTYQYDPAGNRIQQTDARNVTVSYSYDALNRPVLADYPGSLEDVQYGYDAGTHGVGRLTSVQDEGGTTTYAYDPGGTLQQATRSIQGQSYVTQYGYDAADQLISITYPSGRLVSYTRNNIGQVTAVETTQNGSITTLASDITYLPFGPSTGMTLGNGLTDSRDFDLDYRVTSIATAALDLSYSYDSRNNVSGITDNLDSARSQSFGYDALSRLNSALGDYGSLSYSYDAIGNRLSETDDGVTTPYTYDTQSHHLLTVGTTAYGYDAAGNVTQKGSQALDYNQANRLTSVQQNGLELLSNLYNAAGQRVMKSAGSQATLYHYGPSGSLLAETDTAGEVQLERVYLNGQPLAQFTPADPITTEPIEEALPVPLPVPVEDPIEPVPPLLEPTPVYPPAEPVVTCLPRGRGAFSRFGRFGFFLPCIWNRFRPPVPVSPPVFRPPFLPPPPPPPALPPEVPPTPFTPPPEENGFKVAYFHLDHLGTPQRLTDRTQTTVWDASYEPFGEVSLKRNRVEQPLRFPGQVADPETGSYQNGMRDYDSATDRYGQFDTLGLGGGINGYVYANANPLSYIDPTGELAFLIPIGLSIAADYAYDQYINPHVQDFIRDKFDCETQRWLRAAGMGIDVLRTIKNPLRKATKEIPDDAIVVRGGTKDLPPPGEVFSGAAGRTLEDAASGVPHGQIRASTAGKIRAGGGRVNHAPEPTRTGAINEKHVNVCLGPGDCPFGPLQPNPVPKPGRIQ